MKIEYNSNREYELKHKDDIENGWKICLKYANIIYENISKDNISEIIYSTDGEFIKELKSNRLRTDNKMKYMRCWNTMINTHSNYKSTDIVKNSIRQLQYVSHINYNN